MINQFESENERKERVWSLFIKILLVPAITAIIIAIFKIITS